MRSQDTVFVIGALTGSAKGRDLAWKFVQDRWADFSDRYTGGFLMARLVKVSHKVTFSRASIIGG